jgi:hypothetical protein
MMAALEEYKTGDSDASKVSAAISSLVSLSDHTTLQNDVNMNEMFRYIIDLSQSSELTTEDVQQIETLVGNMMTDSEVSSL